jgi:hypothetical protein
VTEVSADSNPGWNVASFGVSAHRAAMFEPAELPATNSFGGSAPYPEPCSRTQVMTFFASIWWPGNVVWGQSR